MEAQKVKIIFQDSTGTIDITWTIHAAKKAKT